MQLSPIIMQRGRGGLCNINCIIAYSRPAGFMQLCNKKCIKNSKKFVTYVTLNT